MAIYIQPQDFGSRNISSISKNHQQYLNRYAYREERNHIVLSGQHYSDEILTKRNYTLTWGIGSETTTWQSPTKTNWAMFQVVVRSPSYFKSSIFGSKQVFCSFYFLLCFGFIWFMMNSKPQVMSYQRLLNIYRFYRREFAENIAECPEQVKIYLGFPQNTLQLRLRL